MSNNFGRLLGCILARLDDGPSSCHFQSLPVAAGHFHFASFVDFYGVRFLHAILIVFNQAVRCIDDVSRGAIVPGQVVG
ncbi:hypothetical protein D3C80_1553710 [compost metagenome]